MANSGRISSARLTIEPLEHRRLMAVDTRPNFVIVNTDDQRADTLSFMPQTLADLGASGTTFENSFVTTALCCPSRSSFLTGQYAHNHDVLRNAPPDGGFQAFDDRSTLATWLDAAGYETALFGKYLNGYDLSAPQNRNPQNTYIPPGWDEWHAMLGAAFYNPRISDNGVTHQYQNQYSTDLLAQRAVNFIQNAEGRDDQPFFVYYTPHAPHTPANPAQRDKGQFAGIAPYRPPSFNEADVSDKPGWVKNLSPLSAANIAEIDQTRKNQLESLQAVDDAVAALVDTLRATGELERTVFIYTSDNGFMWGEHRYAFKGNAYEESIRVPLIIRDGRNPVRRTTDEFALNIDLAPTVLNMAGIAIPGSVDGRSLAPLVRGQQVAWRDDFLVEHWSGERPGEHAAVRTQRWTYVEYKNGDRELYDLANDPFQLRSVHNNPANADVISQLSARIKQLKGQPGPPPATTYYLSTTTGGSLTSSNGASVAFTDADILQLAVQAGGAFQYSLHFDGSDVGLTLASEDIDAFTVRPDGSILVSTVGAFSVRTQYTSPGVGAGGTLSGGGEDVLQFRPSSRGANTAGTWSIMLDGSTRGLTGPAENVDAVGVLPDGRLLISTSGAVAAGGVSGADEDLLAVNLANGAWSLYFDGSDVGLTVNDAEDVDAIFVQPGAAGTPPTLFLSTRGAFAVPGATGQNEDIVKFKPSQVGANTAGTFGPGLAFDGSRFGLTSFDLDGFQIRSASATAASAGIASPASSAPPLPDLSPSTAARALDKVMVALASTSKSGDATVIRDGSSGGSTAATNPEVAVPARGQAAIAALALKLAKRVAAESGQPPKLALERILALGHIFADSSLDLGNVV